MNSLITKVNIELAKNALEFGRNANAVYSLILDSYRDAVIAQLEIFKETLKIESPVLREYLDQEDIYSYKFLLAPEMTNLLFNHKENLTGIYEFIVKALAAEKAKAEKSFDTRLYPYLWTANGDYLLQWDQDEKDFIEFEANCLFDKVPVDFFSPYCSRVTGNELYEPVDSIVSDYSYEEYLELCDIIEKATDPMFQLNQDVVDLIAEFTKVIVLKKQDRNGEKHFFSSTNGNFIGRTVLGNTELVSPEIIAESVVHEAIHSLLFMIDKNDPWIPTMEVSDAIGNKVQSNWTGNSISIMSYMQAVFVWYGLFNFWKTAVDNGIYDQNFANKRLGFIRKGFATVDLNMTSRKYGIRFDHTVLDTVSAVTEQVMKF